EIQIVKRFYSRSCIGWHLEDGALTKMHFTAPVYAHLAAVLAYASFALALVLRSARSRVTAAYAAAAVMTAAWAGMIVLAEWAIVPHAAPAFMASLRDGAWYAVVLTICYLIGQDRRQWQLFAIATASIVAVHDI